MAACARAVVGGGDVREAATELAGALGEPAILIVFATYLASTRDLARELAGRFPDAKVVGCTSHGELGPDGASVGTIAALALYAPAFSAGVGVARDLHGHPFAASRHAVTAAAAALGRAPGDLDPRRHVAITLFDGQTSLAEGFCLATASMVPQIQFVGGAASDQIGSTASPRIFIGEEVVEGGGVVVMLETELPFAVVAWEHMVRTSVKAVVTRAAPEQRLLHELDGQPAVARYRALVAEQGGEITDRESAAVFPFARMIQGKPYVRSVYDLEGTSLRMASACETGQVLRLMRAGDLVGSTRRELERADLDVGGMGGLLAFSCLARHQEAGRFGLADGLDAVYARYPVLGFHTFGEQFGATLVNHTLTGLVLGTSGG